MVVQPVCRQGLSMAALEKQTFHGPSVSYCDVSTISGSRACIQGSSLGPSGCTSRSRSWRSYSCWSKNWDRLLRSMPCASSPPPPPPPPPLLPPDPPPQAARTTAATIAAVTSSASPPVSLATRRSFPSPPRAPPPRRRRRFPARRLSWPGVRRGTLHGFPNGSPARAHPPPLSRQRIRQPPLPRRD